MISVYGEIPNTALKSNISDLINQVFKLLPYKEQNHANLDQAFTALLFRMGGMADLFEQEPRWVTLLSFLEAARKENDFRMYRKSILDVCSILSEIKEQLPDA